MNDINEDIYSFHYKLLAFMGLWSYDFKNPTNQKLFFGYRCLIFMFIVGALILAFVELFEARHNLKQISFNLSTTLFATVIIVKNVLLAAATDRINRLRLNLFQDSLLQENEIHKEIKLYFWKIFVVGKKTFYYAGMIFFPIWLGTSLYTLKDGPRQVPFSIWLPLNLDIDHHFAMAFTFHAIVGAYITLEAIHGELAAFSIGIQLATQIKILAHDISQIGDRHLVNKSSRATGIDVKLKSDLKKCIQRHVRINGYLKEVEASYSLSCFLGLGMAMALMVVNGGELLQVMVSGFRLKWYYQSGYTVMIMIDVFIFCWMGTLIKNEQEGLAETLYDLPWYEMNKKLQKDLFFLMQIGVLLERPLIVCKVIKGNLNMFLGVLKIVSSWLALFWQFMKSTV